MPVRFHLRQLFPLLDQHQALAGQLVRNDRQFVQPFAPGVRASGAPVAGKWMVSSNGTLGLARWRGDSKELFWLSAQNNQLMAADITVAGSRVTAGAPRALFDSGYVNYGHPGNYHVFAAARDGQRFLIPRPDSANDPNARTLTLIGLFDMWDDTMKTISMIFVCTVMSIIIGIPIGGTEGPGIRPYVVGGVGVAGLVAAGADDGDDFLLAVGRQPEQLELAGFAQVDASRRFALPEHDLALLRPHAPGAGQYLLFGFRVQTRQHGVLLQVRGRNGDMGHVLG